MMLVMLLMFLLLPGVGLAQSKEAAEVTLFEGQGLMQALVDAGYDFRLYTELRKVSPDGDAVKCGSPSGFEIRTMHPQILWLPAGAKVNQTRLKQCLAVENELFGNKQTIVHQPTQKPRAVRIPVPKPAPAPPVATPKKQPAPKREISEARPTAPANKQPSPKPAVIPAPKVLFDSQSTREAEQMLSSELSRSTRLAPPPSSAKNTLTGKQPVIDPILEKIQRQIQRDRAELEMLNGASDMLREKSLGLPKPKRQDPVQKQPRSDASTSTVPHNPQQAAVKFRISQLQKEIRDLNRKEEKRQAAAAIAEATRRAQKNAPPPPPTPFPWKMFWLALGVGSVAVALLIIGLQVSSFWEEKRIQQAVTAERLKAAQATEENSQAISPRAARRLAGEHPSGPLSVMELDEAAHIVARAEGMKLVSRERNKAS